MNQSKQVDALAWILFLWVGAGFEKSSRRGAGGSGLGAIWAHRRQPLGCKARRSAGQTKGRPRDKGSRPRLRRAPSKGRGLAPWLRPLAPRANVTVRPGGVAMAALSGLASALESYRGRDRLVRLGRSALGGLGPGPELRDGKLRPERGGVAQDPRSLRPSPPGLRPCPLAVDIRLFLPTCRGRIFSVPTKSARLNCWGPTRPLRMVTGLSRSQDLGCCRTPSTAGHLGCDHTPCNRAQKLCQSAQPGWTFPSQPSPCVNS